jgi:hypothetical protein
VLQHNEIREGKETPGIYPAGFQTRDSLQIEEILRRAREIHRQHGGVFGYDFEDWAQAWTELPQSASGPEPQFAAENGAEFLRELETEVCE